MCGEAAILGHRRDGHRCVFEQLLRPAETQLALLFERIRRGERVDYAGASGDVDLDENGDVQGDLVTWVAKGGAIVETGRVPPAK